MIFLYFPLLIFTFYAVPHFSAPPAFIGFTRNQTTFYSNILCVVALESILNVCM